MDAYRSLRERTDRAGARLVVLHAEHLACRAGCHDCCTELSVSAVEYAAILADLRSAGVTAESLAPVEPGAACSFLTGGLCGIYAARPLICRTHGLPVAFREEAGDDGPENPPGVNVSFCPKNFTSADAADVEFGPDSTLDLDGLNAALADANVTHAAGARADARVPLRQLRRDLSGPSPLYAGERVRVRGGA